MYLKCFIVLQLFCLLKPKLYLVNIKDDARRKEGRLDYKNHVKGSQKPSLKTLPADGNGCTNDLEVLINKERVGKGLKALQCDKIMRGVAKKHNHNLIENNIEIPPCGHCWFGDLACEQSDDTTWCTPTKPWTLFEDRRVGWKH